MASNLGKIITRLQADNPDLVVNNEGKKHIRLYLNGQLVGILPFRLRTEGLAQNTVSQLRRAGLTVAR
jgi:hypothetical protein